MFHLQRVVDAGAFGFSIFSHAFDGLTRCPLRSSFMNPAPSAGSWWPTSPATPSIKQQG